MHSVRSQGSASSHQLAIRFHHARIASLDRTQLGVITNLRDFDATAIDRVDKAFTRLDRLRFAIDCG
jgi:hypothetical protein